jgi:hypothetical protein
MGGVGLDACHQRPLFGPLQVVVGPLQSKLWELYQGVLEYTPILPFPSISLGQKWWEIVLGL